MAAAKLVVIVADERDDTARVVAATAMTRSTFLQYLVITTPELALARWRQTISARGIVETSITLRGGTLRDDDVAVVWCRSSEIARPPFTGWRDADRAYASAELTALVVSWLSGLGERVVNRATGTSATGPAWPQTKWADEARRAGLCVAARRLVTSARLLPTWTGSPYDARLPSTHSADADSTVLVAGEHVVGTEDPQIQEAARRLALAAGCRFLRLLTAGPRRHVVSVDSIGATLTAVDVDAAVEMLSAIASARAYEVVR